MFGRKGKQHVDQDEDQPDHEYHQPVSYWRGVLIAFWPRRLFDTLKLLFSQRALMIVRIRKDRKQDHMVFIPRQVQQETINWGTETYDIEETAIIRDNGRNIMYVVEGCRKPIRMLAWLDVCNKAVEITNSCLNTEDLKKHGKVSISSSDAYTKMNNRDAVMLMRASKDRFAEYSTYLAGIAALTGIILVAMMFGLVPSGVYGLLEGMQEFLLSKAAELESMRV